MEFCIRSLPASARREEEGNVTGFVEPLESSRRRVTAAKWSEQILNPNPSIIGESASESISHLRSSNTGVHIRNFECQFRVPTLLKSLHFVDREGSIHSVPERPDCVEKLARCLQVGAGNLQNWAVIRSICYEVDPGSVGWHSLQCFKIRPSDFTKCLRFIFHFPSSLTSPSDLIGRGMTGGWVGGRF